MLGTEFRNVTIVHTTEDTNWCNYITGKFNSVPDKFTLKVSTVDVSTYYGPNNTEIETAVKESYVVVLLSTCFFLEYMEREHEWLVPMLEHRDKNITTIVAATLDVTPDDFQQIAEKYNYNQDGVWEILKIETDGTNIMKCNSDILGFNDRNIETQEARIRIPRRVSCPTKLDSTGTGEPILIFPETIHWEGEKVALIFTKEKAKGSVSVHYKDINIPVETINPFCVTFKAPEITGSKIYLQLDINNKRRRLKLYNGSPVPQFTSVELMCQSYGGIKKEDLDKKLAEKFTLSLYPNSTAMMIFKDMKSKTGRQNCLYPTLLHWAAANELRELCSALLSAPGAYEACNISNCEDDDVADLAEKNGCVDLANLITEFTQGLEHIQETKEMADACNYYVQSVQSTDSLYEQMTAPKPVKLTGPPVAPRPPLKKTSTSSIKTLDHIPDEDDNYVTPENYTMLTAEEFLTAKIDYPLSVGALGSRSQTELIEIQKEVKNGNFSIQEAEMLFSAWKARYETGNAISFKERKQSLQAMREEHKKAMEVLAAAKNKSKGKAKKNSISEITEFAKIISEPVGMRQKTEKAMLLLQEREGIGIDRTNHDSGRYSGRESTLSQTSTSSEDIEFESDTKQLMRVNRCQSESSSKKSFNNRQSMQIQFLEVVKDLPDGPPPPLPPRLNRSPQAIGGQPPAVNPKPSSIKGFKQPSITKSSTVFSKK